jgi:ribosome-binding factor A
MTKGSRADRVGDLIRMELSTILTRDLRDPGIKNITVTRVKMTKDLQLARVYYMTPTDEKILKNAAQALRRARSFLKRKLAQRLHLRHMPELTFLYDDSIEKQSNVERLLDQIASDQKTSNCNNHEPNEA